MVQGGLLLMFLYLVFLVSASKHDLFIMMPIRAVVASPYQNGKLEKSGITIDIDASFASS